MSTHETVFGTYWAWPPHVPRANDRPPVNEACARDLASRWATPPEERGHRRSRASRERRVGRATSRKAAR